MHNLLGSRHRSLDLFHLFQEAGQLQGVNVNNEGGRTAVAVGAVEPPRIVLKRCTMLKYMKWMSSYLCVQIGPSCRLSCSLPSGTLDIVTMIVSMHIENIIMNILNLRVQLIFTQPAAA
jgi:hypothetical protein